MTDVYRRFFVVFRTSKIQFWKQITTSCLRLPSLKRLFSEHQRYNFESKSQLRRGKGKRPRCCFQNIKDTILKANHNPSLFVKYFKKLFSEHQRYNFESKSQLDAIAGYLINGCFQNIKDTILKANHNAIRFHSATPQVVFRTSKIQFWKQITTWNAYINVGHRLFSEHQRYNFESKSQLFRWRDDSLSCCFQNIKDTILKANHNLA